jgi:hypothetical protein
MMVDLPPLLLLLLLLPAVALLQAAVVLLGWGPSAAARAQSPQHATQCRPQQETHLQAQRTAVLCISGSWQQHAKSLQHM